MHSAVLSSLGRGLPARDPQCWHLRVQASVISQTTWTGMCRWKSSPVRKRAGRCSGSAMTPALAGLVSLLLELGDLDLERLQGGGDIAPLPDEVLGLLGRRLHLRQVSGSHGLEDRGAIGGNRHGVTSFCYRFGFSYIPVSPVSQDAVRGARSRQAEVGSPRPFSTPTSGRPRPLGSGLGRSPMSAEPSKSRPRRRLAGLALFLLVLAALALV